MKVCYLKRRWNDPVDVSCGWYGEWVMCLCGGHLAACSAHVCLMPKGRTWRSMLHATSSLNQVHHDYIESQAQTRCTEAKVFRGTISWCTQQS